MSRIDYLKAQIVQSQALEKTMPQGSPSRVYLERSRAEFEQELDSWLNLPKQKSAAPIPLARHDKMSHLVAELASQLSVANLPPFEAELRFHPERKWRFDLAWPNSKVAVEVHGGVDTKFGDVRGRHVRGKGFINDREKMNEAALLGWLVLEVTGDQIRSGQALTWVERALKVRGG